MSGPKSKTMPMSSPANYVSRCEPFESREDAEATSDAFFADLYALVSKHGIPDLTFLWAATVKDDSKPNGIGAFLQRGHMGDPENGARMRFAQIEIELTGDNDLDEAGRALADGVRQAVESAGVVAPRHFRWDFPLLRAALQGAKPSADEGKAEEAVAP